MPLPTFIIDGNGRGGTTSLYYAIQQHPEIYLCPYSELNYFVEDDIRGPKRREDSVDPKRWETIHRIKDYAALLSISKNARDICCKRADLLLRQPGHDRIKFFVPGKAELHMKLA